MAVKVMRAVPGAGKSTHAKKLKASWEATLPTTSIHILSTDDFFMVDGEYKFDWRKLGEAHQTTQRKFLEAVKDPHAQIIVDNTNTSIAEFGWYVTTGMLFGHDVEILTFLVDPKVAWARNTHGVPAEAVNRMDERLREDTSRMPPYWKNTIVSI